MRQIFGLTFIEEKNAQETIAKYTIIELVVANTLLITLAFFFPDSILLLPLAYLASLIGLRRYWCNSIIKTAIKEDAFDKELWPYGWYMTKIKGLSVFIQYIDKIIIGFFNAELLAVYMLAIKPIDMLSNLFKNFLFIFFPNLAKTETQTIATKWLLVLFFIGIIIATILYFIAPLLITLLYSEKYKDAIALFRKLVFLIPITLIINFFKIKMLAQKQKDLIIAYHIYAPLWSIALILVVSLYTQNLAYIFLTKEYAIRLSKFFYSFK